MSGWFRGKHKGLRIAAIAVGAAGLLAAAVIGYAILNLNSLIERNQKRILARVSATLGRPVQVHQLAAQVGWGASIEVTGLTIADDAAFSQRPFVEAGEVSVEVEFLPLLTGEARVSRLVLIKPAIRILKNTSGAFNIGTLGGTQNAPAETTEGPSTLSGASRAALATLSINELSIEDATLLYKDTSETGEPIRIRHLDLDATDLSATAPFEATLKLAVLGEVQNVTIFGKVGPLLRGATFDTARIPVDLTVEAGPTTLDRVSKLASVGSSIPAQLSLPDPVSIEGTIKGSLDRLALRAKSDLSQDRVAYGDVFNKPAGTAMTLDAKGEWAGGEFSITGAHLGLADLDLTASHVSLGNPPSAKIDTDSFSLAMLSRTVVPLGSLSLSGKCEIDGSVKLDNGSPAIDATVTLAQVAVQPPKLPRLTDVTGKIRFIKNTATIERTTFAVGSAKGSLEGKATSLQPLAASYVLKADAVKLAEVYPGRPADEVISGLEVTGTVEGEPTSPSVNARVKSVSGKAAGIPYNNFDWAAGYAGGRVSARPLKADLFEGSLSTEADAVLGAMPRFNAAVKMKHVNLDQALPALGLQPVHSVRGYLTGVVAMSGNGAKWEQIKPNLAGNGKLALERGKLVGINIVAVVINKIAAAPGVSQLVNAAFMSSHHGLLADPDTELQQASLSFTLASQRITTHDLTVQSPGYGITGDGWFDMDKNINMTGDISFTFGLTVAIPMLVAGRIPVIIVLPDIPKLAERVAIGAVNAPINIIKGGVNGIRGGLNGVGNTLKDWFH